MTKMYQICLFLLLILGLAISAPSNDKKNLKAILRGALPTHRYYTAAVYDGEHSAYVIGGEDSTSGYLKDILHFNVSSGVLEVVGQFPIPVSKGGAAITQSGDVFYTGSFTQNVSLSKHIWHFHISDPSSPTVVHNLSEMGLRPSVTTDGVNVYIVAGTRLGCSHDIIRYNPSTHETETVAKLPRCLNTVATVWAQDALYILGGAENYGLPFDEILKYSPGNSVELLSAKLPIGLRESTAVYDSKSNNIYLIGGYRGNLPPTHHKLTKVNLNNLQTELIDVANFPESLINSAIYVPKDHRIIVFGGRQTHVNYNFIYGIDL